MVHNDVIMRLLSQRWRDYASLAYPATAMRCLAAWAVGGLTLAGWPAARSRLSRCLRRCCQQSLRESLAFFTGVLQLVCRDGSSC